MGWKAFKHHYRIAHIVHVTDRGLCIGSPYIHDIIVVGTHGSLVKRYEWSGNSDLERYQREIEADPSLALKLMQTDDVFQKSVTVYTWSDGVVIEKQAEEVGWPNATHDGQLMYDNMFTDDPQKAARRAKEEAMAEVGFLVDRAGELKQGMTRLNARIRLLRTAIGGPA